MANELYGRMKELGVDMAWYDKAKSKMPKDLNQGPVPLHDEVCGSLSLYLLDKIGRMFTTTSKGEEYMQVRDNLGKRTEVVFVCAACGLQFDKYDEGTKHYGATEIET